MPRIVVAVAVVVIVAGSIGVNIAQHPVVWEMVGSTDFPSESREAAPAVEPIDSTRVTDLSQVAPPESLVPPPVKPVSETVASEATATETRDEPGVSTQLVSSRPSPPESSRTAPEAAAIDAPKGSSPDAAAGPMGPPTPGAGESSTRTPPAGGPSRDTRWPAEVAPAMKYTSNRPAAVDPPAADSEAKPEAKPAVAPGPLVPVVWPDSSPSGGATVTPVSNPTKIERLPPVGDAKPVAAHDAGATSGGAAPSYPSTGK